MNKFKSVIYYNLIPIVGRFFVWRNRYCNVIYYHDIVQTQGRSFMQTNIDVFKSQMQYLASNGYETLRFDDLSNPIKNKHECKRVLIAFDDGWVSNYTEIFQFMKSLGIHYNVFLAVGKIGIDENYLSWDMVREMYDSGICGFGTHTYNHADLSSLNTETYCEEIDAANKVFYDELGYRPKDFCFPYGKYSEESISVLESSSSYERLYTSNMMYSYKKDRAMIMGRNGISNDEPFGVFKNKLKGYYNVYCLFKK